MLKPAKTCGYISHPQDLQALDSFVIAMLGLTHEIIGPTLFAWAPEWFGLFAWHGTRIGAILIGLACLGGVFGALNVPTVAVGIAAGIDGFAAIALMAIKVQQFHARFELRPEDARVISEQSTAMTRADIRMPSRS